MPTNATQVDELRWKKFQVLDDGFVCLVDVMGDDQSVVQAARVSYGEGTRKVSDDRGLIRYLMRHRHSTPFEMAEIKLLVRVPMDTWRQWIRHRTANVNEYSHALFAGDRCHARNARPTAGAAQAATNRQGSGEPLDAQLGAELVGRGAGLAARSARRLRACIAAGVAREQARKDLPLSTYTEAYWKVDLHNLLHFLALRMDSHAQWEIRSYATTIGEQIVRPLFPLVWEAFDDYRLRGHVSHAARPGSDSPPARPTGRELAEARRRTRIFWPCRIPSWAALSALARARRMPGQAGLARSPATASRRKHTYD